MNNIQDPILPLTTSPGYRDELNRQLYSVLRSIRLLVNGLSNGEIGAINNAYTAAPTDGAHNQGDFVRNSAPTELGSASSKYVILGWVCVSSGTPGTWRECRCLTGN